MGELSNWLTPDPHGPLTPQTVGRKVSLSNFSRSLGNWRQFNRAHFTIPLLVVKWCSEKQSYNHKWVNTDRAQYVRSSSGPITIVQERDMRETQESRPIDGAIWNERCHSSSQINWRHYYLLLISDLAQLSIHNSALTPNHVVYTEVKNASKYCTLPFPPNVTLLNIQKTTKNIHTHQNRNCKVLEYRNLRDAHTKSD